MGFRDFIHRVSAPASAGEARASIEDPNIPISSPRILELFGLNEISASGQNVTIDSALGVPAVSAAVNFLSGTIAGLPLNTFERTEEGKTQVTGQLATILHDAVNDGMSSFDWRNYMYGQILTEGRGVSFIERNTARRPINIFPLESRNVTVKRQRGRKIYEYRDGKRTVTYQADEIIDIPFKLKPDMLGHYSPIMTNKDTIGLALAVTQYGSRFFQNGGVPPFAIEGPFESPAGAQRASEQLAAATIKAAKENRLALSIPAGHKLHQLGIDAEKSQLTETQRFLIEQFARIWSMPPVFLQDLTHGTFSNTEQQDLHLVKHTLRRHVEQFEQELNLKLFGRFNRKVFAELNMDGLLRGDFKARMEGYVRGIQGAVLKPNEVRRKENLPDDPNGDQLLIQGATVPLGSQPLAPVQPPQPDPQEGNDDGA